MKVVINSCYGGFSLSHEAIMRYCEIKGINVYPIQEDKWGFTTYSKVPVESRSNFDNFYTLTIEDRKEYNRKYEEQTFYPDEISRNDPALIQVVEELGKAANGKHAELKVVNIPDDVDFEIEDYDGMETICERRRKWS